MTERLPSLEPPAAPPIRRMPLKTEKTPTYYVYKCTTQQLEAALNHIVESGDQVVQPAFLGGRDWLIVCIKAANEPVASDG